MFGRFFFYLLLFTVEQGQGRHFVAGQIGRTFELKFKKFKLKLFKLTIA